MQGLHSLHLLQHWLGYEDAVKEKGRETLNKIDIEDEYKKILDSKLQIILEKINHKPEITVTYFIKDKLKEGGAYHTSCGLVKKIDFNNQNLYFVNNEQIPIEDIIDIKGDIFKILE